MVNDPTGVFRICRGLCLESEDSAERYLKEKTTAAAVQKGTAAAVVFMLFAIAIVGYQLQRAFMKIG